MTTTSASGSLPPDTSDRVIDDTAEQGLAFDVLGSLEIRHNGESIPLTGVIKKRLLTILLLEAGRVVPVSRLVETAWETCAPETAFHQVRKTMAELRRRIPGGESVVLTSGPGYRVDLDENQLDLLRYRSLLRRGHAALEAADNDRAAHLLRTALRLWRGPVLDGEGGPIIEAVSSTLQEQHLDAAERLYGLLASMGEAASVLDELRSLVEENPLRENLRGQLMLTLYRTGQQAAALEEFRRIRELLADELGIDPGGELSELHERILRQDPSLAPPEQTSTPATPRLLPYDIPEFVGRDRELNRIRQVVDQARQEAPTILAIDGMGGSGKTALVIRAAHQLADHYTGGALFIDLQGFTPGQEPLSPFQAQGDLLAMVGIPGEQIPNTSTRRDALWQSYTQGHPMLLILDNAASSEQVRRLVPSAAGNLVLVTSRPRLTGLEGANWLSLDTLPEPDAHEILRKSLGEQRLSREPGMATELLRLCGGLPLALRIAAARLANRPRWTIQHLVDRLRNDERRLNELNSEDRGISSTLFLSYQSISDRLRTAFRFLGQHPGRYIDVSEAAALLDTDTTEAEDVLEALVDARLLDSGEPGVYAFHDLVRSFIHRMVQSEHTPDARKAVKRLLDFYTETSAAACDMLFPGRSQYSTRIRKGTGSSEPFADKDVALEWLDRHRESLLAALDLPRDRDILWHLAYLPRELGFHSSLRGYDSSANHALEKGIEASRELEDLELLRFNLTNLAMGQWRLGQLKKAVARLEEARELARSMDDQCSEAECVARLGQAYNSLGQLDQALQLSEEANRTARSIGFTRLDGSSLSTLSQVKTRLGRHTEAKETAENALEIFDTLGETQLSISTLLYLSQALERLVRYSEALERTDEALERCGNLSGSSTLLPLVLARHADTLTRMERFDEAAETSTRALAETSNCTNDIHRAAVHLSVGYTSHARGNDQRAENHLSICHEIAHRMELRYEQAYALYGLTEVKLATGDLDAAEKCRAEVAALFALMGVPDDPPSAPRRGEP